MFIRTQSSGYNERFIPLKGKAGLIPTLKSSENAEMKTLQSGHVHKQLDTTTLRQMTVRCQMTMTFIQGTHSTPYTPLRSVISKVVQNFIYFHHHIRTGSGIHPASYSTVPGVAVGHDSVGATATRSGLDGTGIEFR